MDFIFELLFELIFEGALSVSSDKKVPNFIRYPLIAFIILFFLGVIVGLFVLGIFSLKKSVIGGIFVIFVSVMLFTMATVKFIKKYINIKDKSDT